LFVAITTSCAGTRTFHEYARAGDTVALGAGWKHNFDKNNITVTFTPDSGGSITYLQGDSAIRGSINMYPDPLSGLVTSYVTGINQTSNALSNSIFLNTATGFDPDWWQTVVFLDIPTSMPVGNVTIDIVNPQGETVSSTFEVIPGAGQVNSFSTDIAPLGNDQFDSLARIPHQIVEFSAVQEVPYAIEVTFTHDPDMDNGGSGKVFVSNPRSESKNMLWYDDGLSTKVILIKDHQTGNESPNLKHFKFYIVGGVNNIQVSSIAAYDENGADVQGVTASLSTTQ